MMLRHDPPLGAVAGVGGRAGDKHTLLLLHSSGLQTSISNVWTWEKEINRRAETHSGFYF